MGADYQVNMHQVAQFNTDRGYSFGDSIPSRVTRIDSHSGDSLGLGVQYVRYPMRAFPVE